MRVDGIRGLHGAVNEIFKYENAAKPVKTNAGISQPPHAVYRKSPLVDMRFPNRKQTQRSPRAPVFQTDGSGAVKVGILKITFLVREFVTFASEQHKFRTLR